MNINDIAGGSVNRFGGIEGVNYRPTGFVIENSGVIRDGYRDSGFRVDQNGDVRNEYGGFTPFRINSFEAVERDVRY